MAVLLTVVYPSATATYETKLLGSIARGPLASPLVDSPVVKRSLRWRLGTLRLKLRQEFDDGDRRWRWRGRPRLVGGARYLPVVVDRDGRPCDGVLDRKTGEVVRTFKYVMQPAAVARGVARQLNEGHEGADLPR